MGIICEAVFCFVYLDLCFISENTISLKKENCYPKSNKWDFLKNFFIWISTVNFIITFVIIYVQKLLLVAFFPFFSFWWPLSNQRLNESWGKFIPSHTCSVYSTTALPDGLADTRHDSPQYPRAPSTGSFAHLSGKGLARQLAFWQHGAYCRHEWLMWSWLVHGWLAKTLSIKYFPQHPRSLEGTLSCSSRSPHTSNYPACVPTGVLLVTVRPGRIRQS